MAFHMLRLIKSRTFSDRFTFAPPFSILLLENTPHKATLTRVRNMTSQKHYSRTNVVSDVDTTSPEAMPSPMATSEVASPQDINSTSSDAAPPQDMERSPNNLETPAEEETDGCPLKRLPAEIRNDIFLLATTESKPIRLMHRKTLPHENVAFKLVNPRQPPTGIALAKTCRQFRQEVIPVFYASNAFLLMDMCADKLPEPDAIAFPLAKARRLIASFRCPSNIQAEIPIEQQEDQNLSIEAVGPMKKRCICRMKDIARDCTGPACLEKLFTSRQFQAYLTELRFAVRGNLAHGVCKSCDGLCYFSWRTEVRT